MSDFQAKNIKESSVYLEEKLSTIKEFSKKRVDENIFRMEKKKTDSSFKKIINSIFSS